MPARAGWLMGLSLCAGVALAADDVSPPLELLEFLGSFETAAGEWVDPVELDVPPPSAQVSADVGENGGQKE